MECITATSMLVLVTGIPDEPLKPERRIRKGNPYLPIYLLFVPNITHFMAKIRNLVLLLK